MGPRGGGRLSGRSSSVTDPDLLAAVSSVTSSLRRSVGERQHSRSVGKGNVDDVYSDSLRNMIVDPLGLGANKQFLKCLKHAKTDDDALTLRRLGRGVEESVVYSCMAIKVRDTDGKPQKRVLCVTNLAIYNLRPGRYKSYRRRMLIEKVGSLLLSSENPEEFVVHFDISGESDYTFLTEQRDHVSLVIQKCYRALTNNDLDTPELETSCVDIVMRGPPSMHRQGLRDVLAGVREALMVDADWPGVKHTAFCDFLKDDAEQRSDTALLQLLVQLIYNNVTFSVFARVCERDFPLASAFLQSTVTLLSSDIFEEQHWAIKLLWQLLRILERLKYVRGGAWWRGRGGKNEEKRESVEKEPVRSACERSDE